MTTVFQDAVPSVPAIPATPIPAAWLNGVDAYVYGGGGGGSANYTPISGIPRTIAGKLKESVSVTDFGAIGDGVTDDSAAINAAIAAVSAAGGGTIYLPTGVYLCGSPIVLKGYVILNGNGFDRTTLRGMPSTSHDIVITDSFATLTGTNTPGGPRCFGLGNLSIDGNKANRTGTGACLKIYGYDYELTNVEIYRSRGIGFYSEWAVFGNVPVTPGGKDTMESHIQGLRTFQCANDGMVFYGPHDTLMRDVLTFINGGRGAVFGEGATYTAGGVMVDQLHSYGNASWGIVTSTMIFAGIMESESNLGGGGIQVNTPGGRVQGGTLLGWGNTGTGVEFNAPSSATSVVANNNTGDGVHLYSATNRLSISSVSNGGNGVSYGPAASNNTVMGCNCYGNAGKGVFFQANDNRLMGLLCGGNGNGGLQISSGVGGLSINGECAANTGIQADLGTLGGPAIIDLVLYTAAGQTGWAGVPGNNFVRIGARGADPRPCNTVQT
jgi:hypothetical protein